MIATDAAGLWHSSFGCKLQLKLPGGLSVPSCTQRALPTHRLPCQHATSFNGWRLCCVLCLSSSEMPGRIGQWKRRKHSKHNSTVRFLQCFDTVGFVIWPVKIVPEMTYNALSGTLSFYTTTATASVQSDFHLVQKREITSLQWNLGLFLAKLLLAPFDKSNWINTIGICFSTDWILRYFSLVLALALSLLASLTTGKKQSSYRFF